MSRKQSEGIVDSFLGMFSPYSTMTRELQAAMQLDRPPSCRGSHGRLEILLRGSGLTDDALENRIVFAQRLTDAARPLLRAHRKREQQRFADRAIAVVFEDEQVVDGGIATSRFTYVASHDRDPRTDGSRSPYDDDRGSR